MFVDGDQGTWMEDKCERGGEATINDSFTCTIVRTIDLTLSRIPLLRIPAVGKKRNLLVEHILAETKI